MKTKRIFREWQHPRDHRGRFARKGSPEWVKAAAEKFRKADEALKAGTHGPGMPSRGEVSAPGRPRIARGAKAERALATHDASVRTGLAPHQPVEGPAPRPASSTRGRLTVGAKQAAMNREKALAALAPGNGAPTGTSATQMREAFADEAKLPGGMRTVRMIDNANPHTWNHLSPREKANAGKAVAAAVAAGEPGADAAAEKVRKLGGYVPQVDTPRVAGKTRGVSTTTPNPRISAHDQRRIRIAVEDHAADFVGGPLGLSKDDAARYTSEGHLKDLVGKYGLSDVWEEVARVIDENPDLLKKAGRKERAAARDQAAGEHATDALYAMKAGRYADALASINKGEAMHPDYRQSGRHSWADMQGVVLKRKAEADAAAAEKAKAEADKPSPEDLAVTRELFKLHPSQRTFDPAASNAARDAARAKAEAEVNSILPSNNFSRSTLRARMGSAAGAVGAFEQQREAKRAEIAHARDLLGQIKDPKLREEYRVGVLKPLEYDEEVLMGAIAQQQRNLDKAREDLASEVKRGGEKLAGQRREEAWRHVMGVQRSGGKGYGSGKGAAIADAVDASPDRSAAIKALSQEDRNHAQDEASLRGMHRDYMQKVVENALRGVDLKNLTPQERQRWADTTGTPTRGLIATLAARTRRDQALSRLDALRGHKLGPDASPEMRTELDKAIKEEQANLDAAQAQLSTLEPKFEQHLAGITAGVNELRAARGLKAAKLNAGTMEKGYAKGLERLGIKAPENPPAPPAPPKGAIERASDAIAAQRDLPEAGAVPGADTAHLKRPGARKGDLAIVERKSTTYYRDKPNETRTEVHLGVVTSTDKSGRITSYSTNADGSYPQKIDNVREKVLKLEAERVDVPAAIEAAKRNEWSPGKPGKPLDSFDHAREVVKPFLGDQTEKLKAARAAAPKGRDPMRLQVGDRVTIPAFRHGDPATTAEVIGEPQTLDNQFGVRGANVRVKMRVLDGPNAGREGFHSYKKSEKAQVLPPAEKPKGAIERASDTIAAQRGLPKADRTPLDPNSRKAADIQAVIDAMPADLPLDDQTRRTYLTHFRGQWSAVMEQPNGKVMGLKDAKTKQEVLDWVAEAQRTRHWFKEVDAAKARGEVPPPPPVEALKGRAKDIAERVKGAATQQEAAAHLDGLKKAELAAVAEASGHSVRSIVGEVQGSADQIRAKILTGKPNAPAAEANPYSSMSRGALLHLARDAKISIKGRSNEDIARDLHAKDQGKAYTAEAPQFSGRIGQKVGGEAVPSAAAPSLSPYEQDHRDFTAHLNRGDRESMLRQARQYGVDTNGKSDAAIVRDTATAYAKEQQGIRDRNARNNATLAAGGQVRTVENGIGGRNLERTGINGRTEPAPRRYQTFADRMAGDMSNSDRMAAIAAREQRLQEARAREAEIARQVAEREANDTRSEREKLTEKLQQARASQDFHRRSGRDYPTVTARIKAMEDRLAELDTEDRKAKVKALDIRNGDKVKNRLGEFEVVGKTKDGYLRVLRPDGKRGSVDPLHVESVTKGVSAPKAGAAESAAPVRWINPRTGGEIANPSQVDIVRGNVVKHDSEAGKAALAKREAALASIPKTDREARIAAPATTRGRLSRALKVSKLDTPRVTSHSGGGKAPTTTEANVNAATARPTSGKPQSWNDVQPGDTIKIHGQRFKVTGLESQPVHPNTSEKFQQYAANTRIVKGHYVKNDGTPGKIGNPRGGAPASTSVHLDNVEFDAPTIAPQKRAAAPEAPKASPIKAPSEPQLGVTESSRGRTTTITLPDGTTATRTSKTMAYTHAVVGTTDEHANARDLHVQAEQSQRYATAVDQWIAEGADLSKLKKYPMAGGSINDQREGRYRTGYYLPGFEPVKVESGGISWYEPRNGAPLVVSEQLKRDPEGTRTWPEWRKSGELVNHTGADAADYQVRSAREAADSARKEAAQLDERAAKLEAGPRYTYAVDRWSQRADTAFAAIGSPGVSRRNTKYQVVTVGGVAKPDTKPAKVVPTAEEKAAAAAAKKAAEAADRASRSKRFFDETRKRIEQDIRDGKDPEGELRYKTEAALRSLAREYGVKLPRLPRNAYGQSQPLDRDNARKLIVEKIRADLGKA